MRIAIIADPLDNQSAGVHTYTRNLIKALAEQDKKHEYILIREKKTGEFPGMKEVAVPNTRLPIGWASFRLFFLIPWKCRQLKVDAVVEPAHFGPWNLPDHIKRVTVIHDLTPIKFPHLHRWHSQFLQKLFLKRILKKTDLILTNSHNTAEDVMEFLPEAKAKTKTIYLGKDQFFKPTKDPAVLEKYGIRHHYFLFTGTIEPRKDLPTLLDAYRQFCDETSERVHLVLAGGKGWKFGKLKKKLKEHPYKMDIIQTGYVPKKDLAALYSQTIAFVYPSIYEGFGLPILEAMSCGAPVIAAKNSSLTEVGGEAATYFETSDSQNLASKLDEAYMNKDVRIHLVTAGLFQAEKFSWEEYAKLFSKYLGEL